MASKGGIPTIGDVYRSWRDWWKIPVLFVFYLLFIPTLFIFCVCDFVPSACRYCYHRLCCRPAARPQPTIPTTITAAPASQRIPQGPEIRHGVAAAFRKPRRALTIDLYPEPLGGCPKKRRRPSPQAYLQHQCILFRSLPPQLRRRVYRHVLLPPDGIELHIVNFRGPICSHPYGPQCTNGGVCRISEDPVDARNRSAGLLCSCRQM